MLCQVNTRVNQYLSPAYDDLKISKAFNSVVRVFFNLSDKMSLAWSVDQGAKRGGGKKKEPDSAIHCRW